mmetsp:Transcript_10873/g.33562  ORF Transcript_10873/g.33562 Transcript_10873/m.33562 type:complete len:98 (-) Transcript_10873:111-404(-)
MAWEPLPIGFMEFRTLNHRGTRLLEHVETDSRVLRLSDHHAAKDNFSSKKLQTLSQGARSVKEMSQPRVQLSVSQPIIICRDSHACSSYELSLSARR